MKRGRLTILCDVFAEQNPQLECDGLTRVLLTVLDNYNITARPMIGAIYAGGLRSRSFFPHCWLECQGWVIDYRIRRIFPYPGVAEGVFRDDDTMASYRGEPWAIVPDLLVFKILIGREDVGDAPPQSAP